MKKNKIQKILVIILLILIIVIVMLKINLKNKTKFIKPPFEQNIITKIPDSIEYDKFLNITKGYSFYIEPLPKISNNFLIINFAAHESNNIWLKVRILQNDEIIAESGLVKPGQYLEKIMLNGNTYLVDKEITYLIMGYEIDTYLSEGIVKLNTRIGE